MAEKNGAEPGAGNVIVELDGKDFELEPSWEACMAISRMHGGCAAAATRCLQLDADTIVEVIGVGIKVNGQRLNPGQITKMVGPAVYKTGLMAVASKCVDFINIVSNGGRPLTPEDQETDEDPLVPGSESGITIET